MITYKVKTTMSPVVALATVVGENVLPLAPTSTLNVAAWTAEPAKRAKVAAVKRSIMGIGMGKCECECKCELGAGTGTGTGED